MRMFALSAALVLAATVAWAEERAPSPAGAEVYIRRSVWCCSGNGLSIASNCPISPLMAVRPHRLLVQQSVREQREYPGGFALDSVGNPVPPHRRG